jgi:hypothetical protein
VDVVVVGQRGLMAATPATAARCTAAGAADGGGVAARVAALAPPRSAVALHGGAAGAALADQIRLVAAVRSPSPSLRAAMARAGAILLQSGLESPDVHKVDIPVASRPARPLRRRTRRYAARRPGLVAVG